MYTSCFRSCRNYLRSEEGDKNASNRYDRDRRRAAGITGEGVKAGYFKILLKIIGITYIAEFASDLCKDAGYATIAGQIQMFGKLSVLAAGIPVLTALLETIRGFLS